MSMHVQELHLINDLYEWLYVLLGTLSIVSYIIVSVLATFYFQDLDLIKSSTSIICEGILKNSRGTVSSI